MRKNKGVSILLTKKLSVSKKNIFFLIGIFLFIFLFANVSAEKVWSFHNYTLNVSNDIYFAGNIYGDGSGLTNLNVSSMNLSGYVPYTGANQNVDLGNNSLNAKYVRTAVFNGNCTTAAATVAKTMTIDNYTLTTGDLIAVNFTLGNTIANPTLNINGAGAKVIRLGNTNVSTYTMYSTVGGFQVLLYYDGTYFQLMGSQRTSDSDTFDRMYWGGAVITAGDIIYDYKLMMQGADGKWYPLTLEEGTGTTKTVSTRQFLINSNVLYYATTTNVAANGTLTNVYSEINTAYLSYTANQASWTSQFPIYLKGTISNGYFVLDNSGYTSFMTQTLPTTEDGYVYMLLGQMYTTSYMRLVQYHPMYEFKGGVLRLYSSSEVDPYWTGNSTLVPYLASINTFTQNNIFNGNLTVGNNYFFVNNNTGRVGIGTSSPTQTLDVRGNIYLPTNNVITWANGDASIGSVTGYNLQFSTYNGSANTEKMRITSSGKIGINTTTPQNTLNVVGDANITGNLYSNGQLVGAGSITGAGTTGYIPVWNGTNSINNSIIYQNGSKIGIGTTNPSQEFEVNGSMKLVNQTFSAQPVTFESETSVGLRMTNNYGYVSITPLNAGWAHIYTDRSNFIFDKAIYDIAGKFASYNTANLTLSSGGTRSDLFIQNSNGYVGIGTTSPTQKLDVNGTMTLRGNGTYANNIGSAELQAGYGIATPSTAGNISRLAIQPYGHTGGPFKFIARDTASTAYLDIDYGSTHGLTLDSSGKIGINTYTPQNTLNVVGDLNVTGNIYGTVLSGGYWNLSGSNLYPANTSYNVGIGTASPTQKLEVNGNILATNFKFNDTNKSISIGNSSGNTLLYNTFLGHEAGYSNTGVIVTAIGSQAGYGNTQGSLVAIGRVAGYSNTGDSATIVGTSAGYQNTGSYSSIFGNQAGYQNTGIHATVMGYNAGSQNKRDFLTAIGSQAGYNNLGEANVFVGTSAGYQSNGSFSTASGYYAGYKNKGNYSSMIGYQAGYENTGSYLIAMGSQAGRLNSGNNSVIAIGYYAGYNNNQNSAILIGQEAGYANTGSLVTAMGHQSGYANAGNSLTAMGFEAGYNNGASNVIAIGYYAGYGNTGSSSVFIGDDAGNYNTGSTTVLAGYQAGFYNTGNSVTAIGNMAGLSNTGNYLSSLGYQSGYENIGNNIISIGNSAGYQNSGNNSIGIGMESLYSNSGNNVVALGYQAGSSNTDSNVFILKQANVNSVPLIYGNFSSGRIGINKQILKASLDIDGNASIGNLLGEIDLNPSGVTLSGNARVKKSVQISIDGVRLSGATASTHNLAAGFYVPQIYFQDAQNNAIYFSVEVPEDMDKSVNPSIRLDWSTGASGSCNMTWQVQYLYRAGNESMGSALVSPDETINTTITSPGNSYGYTNSEISFGNAPASTDEFVSFNLRRLGSAAGDTCTTYGYVYRLSFEYTSNKIGAGL